MIEEAKVIRLALAERAPEIDNSDLQEPDGGSHDRWRYVLHSFANFDRLADANHATRYPVIPRGDDDLAPISKLLGILRGRFKVATLGEDAGINADPIRDDLDDLGRRIGNLGERHRTSLQRYRQEARTLPWMAYARLVYFGSDLVAESVEIETDEDAERFLDRSLREWGQPKTIARKLATGERLEAWERRSTADVELMLKGEAERLNRELVRRLADTPAEAQGAPATAVVPISRAPARFDSIDEARAFCREFFDWYNHQHRHSGIGLLTPATVHHGQAEQTHAARRAVLDAAYAATPERFVRQPPRPPALPTGAWTNKPHTEEVAH